MDGPCSSSYRVYWTYGTKKVDYAVDISAQGLE
jgi:hypothetical protein